MMGINLATTFITLLPVAAAHIKMVAPPSVNSTIFPLEPSMFPCHGLDPAFSHLTTIKAGESTLVSLEGGEVNSKAVHGGGSCQFSLAKRDKATDPQDWKVIRTIIGGCPSTAEGNVAALCSGPETNETDCLKSYTVQIPKEVPDGEYYFSWSW